MSITPRQRAALVGRLRALPRGGAPSPTREAQGPEERCDFCRRVIPPEHRHLLHLDERRIICTCPQCWALRAGDPEYRPTGARTLWLPDLDLPDDLWARFAIPIGLAFFFHSAPAARVLGLYPSPAGATECELDLEAWDLLVAANPLLAGLEPDIEGLIVNRMATPPLYAVAPIDRCYELVGRIKASWRGISGGPEVEGAVAAYFADLRARAAAATPAGGA